MKIEARGFVTEKSYSGYEANLNHYTVSIVCDLEPVKAAISGKIPLLVFIGSEIDQELNSALQSHNLVRITVETINDPR